MDKEQNENQRCKEGEEWMPKDDNHGRDVNDDSDDDV